MWFAILTPGGDPSRVTATGEATVFSWSTAARQRINEPMHAVQGGLRVSRRVFFDQGVSPAPPGCFTCRAPVQVPDADALRASPDTMRQPEDVGLPSLTSHGELPALLVLVHLIDLTGPEDDPDLTEEALLTLPQERFALLLALSELPEAIGVLSAVATDIAAPTCTACGSSLPGGPAERARVERRTELLYGRPQRRRRAA